MKKLLTTLFCATIFLSQNITAQVPGWSVLNSGTPYDLLGISVVDANVAYACGSFGTILKTSDGGNSWINLPTGIPLDLYPIRFSDELNGFTAGDDGVFLRTTDGGLTWIDLGLNPMVRFRNIYFYDSSVGYAVGLLSGNAGVVYKTIDGGTTWNAQNIASTSGIYGIMFTSLTDGYCSNYFGTIFNTNDGGVTWNPDPTVSSNTLTDLYFTNPSVGVTVGSNGTILNTIDNGVTWNSVSSGTADWLAGLEFMNTNEGFIVGGDIAANDGVMLQTGDGGLTWSSYSSATSRLTNIDFTGSTGYAVGLDGTIMKYVTTVGISENTSTTDLTVYPNPSSNMISVSSENFQSGEADVNIYDVKGSLVYQNCITITGKTFTIPVYSFDSGMYNLNIQQQNKQFSLSFIKTE